MHRHVGLLMAPRYTPEDVTEPSTVGTYECWDNPVWPIHPGCSGLSGILPALESCRASSHFLIVVISPGQKSSMLRGMCPLTEFIPSASVDNIRLWNIADGENPGRSKSPVQFKIIPGHHGGYISQMSMTISCLSGRAEAKISFSSHRHRFSLPNQCQ
jgi:hypothetical protein